MEEIKALFGTSPILSKLYDIARIVDPVGKIVYKHADNETVTEDFKCFDFWGNNEVCENCISMRAYNENETCVKLEFNRNMIYLVTAIPHDLNCRRIVIELLKEVTNTIQLGKNDIATAEMKEIHDLIDNMNRLAFRDYLTGTYNRRFINEKLPADILRSVLSSQPLALLMSDLDSFKDINDNYGHVVGDTALKRYAELLLVIAEREGGWAARYGGDEFLICLPGSDLKKAAQVGETLRKEAEGIKIKTSGCEITLSASIGVFVAEANARMRAEDALRLVDEKMYSAKNKGRNRVEY